MTLSLFPAPADLDPPLPERVPCISLWEPYASLVVAGVKTIETRTWKWPYPPGWLAIHKAKHLDRQANRRLDKRIVDAGVHLQVGLHLGSVVGLVFVEGSRELRPEDEHAACFYEPGRCAWPLSGARKLARPIVMRGPQKIQFLPRAQVLESL